MSDFEMRDALMALMQKYNETRTTWIAIYGDATGFDAWFTQWVLGKS